MYTAANKIKELRDAGWKVKVQVWRDARVSSDSRVQRVSRKDGVSGHSFIATGGQTAVFVLPPGGTIGFTGVSVCHPEKDNFNKKIGLEIALGRALRKAGFQDPAS